ncbi:four helix bundle protein [Vibrio agarivorans]|uniref:four helix bundle protein n=1 Tax=Vibrio agarivorans TaxID=153622 RepID=UPI0025B41F96|nr:four helix bundle protein [Vibrio agarivorans]MDN3662187.1 four helix bundle protein [Vibrio agarivorans]
MRFEKLDIWKRSSKLSCDIYLVTKSLKDYGFKDQITRAGLSIPSNIAEGEERDSLKEKVRFLNIAQGSTAELITQLMIGIRIGYIDNTIGSTLIREAKQLYAMIKSLIKAKQTQMN